jgi:hypothetical protein
MKLHTTIDKLMIKGSLIPKGSKAIFMPFLKFGQAIVKAIFIKNS